LGEFKSVSAVDRYYPEVRGKPQGLNTGKDGTFGGNFTLSSLFRLICPIRFHEIFQLLGLHIHAFLNTSTVENYFLSSGNTRSFDDKKQFMTDFVNGMYATIGLGFILTLGIFNVEFNFIKPVNSKSLKEEFKKFEVNIYVQPQ
jgi:hypothetical protein